MAVTLGLPIMVPALHCGGFAARLWSPLVPSMASYGFSPSQVEGIIKVTDKVSNSARLSVISPSDGFKRLSLRPTSVDFFSLYGKPESRSRPSTAFYEKMDSEKVPRPDLQSLPSWAASTGSTGSTGSDSDKSLLSRRDSVASRFRKRASRIFG